MNWFRTDRRPVLNHGQTKTPPVFAPLEEQKTNRINLYHVEKQVPGHGGAKIMKRYLIKAERKTTYRLETISRIVECDNIEEVIKIRFRAYDAFLQSFFSKANARILSIDEL